MSFCAKMFACMIKFTVWIVINPLSPNVAIWNLILLWSWTSRTTPRSSATHAPGSGLISTDAAVQK